MLTKEYLHFLWREVVEGVDEVVFGCLVETMAVHDAMFPCIDGVIEGGAREFMVPARLPGSVTEASLAKLQEVVSRGTRMQIVIEIYANYVPPAIIAQFLGAFGRNGDEDIRTLVFHTCWARGASFEVNGRECLIRLGEASTESSWGEDSTETRRIIEINIAGHNRTNVSKIGSKLKDNVKKLLQERYPGLLFDLMDHTYMDGTEAWQGIMKALQGELLEKLEKVMARTSAVGLKFALGVRSIWVFVAASHGSVLLFRHGCFRSDVRIPCGACNGDFHVMPSPFFARTC